jgi:hypothetical protein
MLCPHFNAQRIGEALSCGSEAFVTVSAGEAWQIYNCDKLRLVMVGPQLGADITALAAKAGRCRLTR